MKQCDVFTSLRDAGGKVMIHQEVLAQRIIMILVNKKIMFFCLVFLINVPAFGGEYKKFGMDFSFLYVYLYNNEFEENVGEGIGIEITYNITNHIAFGITTEMIPSSIPPLFFGGVSLKIKSPSKEFIPGIRIKGGGAYLQKDYYEIFSPYIGFGMDFQFNFTDSIGIGMIIDGDFFFKSEEVFGNIFTLTTGLGLRTMF
jgi:hypothetical protein